MARPKKSAVVDQDNDELYSDIDPELENFEETGESEESFYADEPAEEKPKKVTAKRPKSTTTKGHYITNSVLLPEVIRAKELGRITNELARMLLLIAERYSCKSSFVGYSFREDMVSFAMVNLMANALKFKPEKSNNPFAFYTTAIRNSFLQYLADEKKHRDIRDELIMDEGFNPSNTYLENNRDSGDGDY